MSIDLNAIAAQIRAEGYAEGYAACLKDMEAFVASKRVITLSAPSSMKELDMEQQDGARAPRGQTKKWVRSVLSGAPAPMTVKQIQEILELLEGHVAYSSIQNALTQIARDGQAEMVGRGVWRFKTNTTPSEQTEGVA